MVGGSRGSVFNMLQFARRAERFMAGADDRMTRFFSKVHISHELGDPSLRHGDLCHIFGDNAGFDFFPIEFAAIKLRKPKLDNASHDTVSAFSAGSSGTVT